MRLFLGAGLALALLSVCCCTAAADERRQALDILDRRTVVRWGDDNVAWVVCYPDDFAELWVKSEAKKMRMKPEQEAEYRKAFTSELRTGAATAVMLSVHAFAQNPVSIAPAGKNISLINSSGKRLTPIAFEKKLDGPISGLTQGFIYFPKQNDDNFSIAVSGLASDGETIFSFTGGNQGPPPIVTASAQQQPKQTKADNTPPPKEVVVKIPTADKPEPPKAPRKPVADKPDGSEKKSDGETFEPFIQQPVSEDAPPRGADVPPLSSSDAPASAARPDPAGEEEEWKPDAAAKRALDSFLNAWIARDAGRMYSMLTEDSKARLSKALFEKSVLSDGFGKALKSGYKVTWQAPGADSAAGTARVTASERKMLFMRSLSAKNINLVREDGSVRVSW
jgi:hypothetical protein